MQRTLHSHPRVKQYRRILLKLSGEALGAEAKVATSVINPDVASRIAQAIATVTSFTQVAIVLGGGNWFRGTQGKEIGIHRVTADHIGMLATVMNALAMKDILEHHALDVRILSAFSIGTHVESFDHAKAKRYLNEGKVVIFAGGTGNPFVSTDSAASLRALEIEADTLFKATAVNGVYDKDPLKYSDAKQYSRLTYHQVIQDELQVMDLAAFIQCRDYRLPIRIFNIHTPSNLIDAVMGKEIGTLITDKAD